MHLRANVSKLVHPRLKRFIKDLPPYKWLQVYREDRSLIKWARDEAMESPPPLFKQRVVKEHAKRFGLRTMVETGTYLGEMVSAVLDDFDSIHSIELDEALHQRAVTLFQEWEHVTVLLGDSGQVLREIVPHLMSPCLFWLDGHYSGGVTARGREDTPIQRALEHILAVGQRGHVLLIDDARCFGTEGYPTIGQVRDQILKVHSEASFAVAEDIIRVTPALF